MFSDEDYTLAQVEFTRLVNYYPSSVYVINAQFLKSVCLFESTPSHYGLDQTSVQESIRQFEDFLIDYPESEMIPQAQAYLRQARTRLAKKDFNAGLTYYRMGTYDAAEIYFQRVIDGYTDTEPAAQALYYLAEIEGKRKNYAEASRKYQNFVTVYPEHEWVGKARERAAKTAFKGAEAAFTNGDPARAKTEFEAFLSTFPDDKRADKARQYLEKIGDVPVESEPESETAAP